MKAAQVVSTVGGRIILLNVLVMCVLVGAVAEAAADPSLVVWYKLDESAGINVDDSSIYDRDVTLYQWPEDAGFTPGWDPDGGHFGGCLVFYDDTQIAIPKEALGTVTNGITVSLWLKDPWRVGMNYVFDAGINNEPAEEFRVMALVSTAPDADVLWRAGNDSNDTLRWDLDGDNVVDLEGWHNWTFIKDEVAGNIRIYLDGSLAESDDVVDPTLSTVLPTKLVHADFDFHLGSNNKFNNDLEGTVDEFVVYDRALSDAEAERLYYTGGYMDIGSAWKPSPAHRGQNLCDDVVLSWSPGDYADEHAVYFGTDGDDVESATTASTEHRVTQGPNSYDAGTLETLNPGVTYYWRIDEVNDNVWAPPGSPWKGQVWEFTINDGNAFDPGPSDGETWVVKEPLLSWSAGCSAASHKVYFSADLSDVESRDLDAYLGETGSTSIDPCAGDLEYLTDYYWVVDEVNGATTWSGQVWSFQTENAITDPNLVLWYKLDDAEQEYDNRGYEARDSSDYVRHAYIRIRNFLYEGHVPDWTPDEGRWGGSLGFKDDTAIWVPPSTLSKLSNAVSIIVWVQEEINCAFHVNGGDSQLKVSFGPVTWRAGNDTNDVLTMGGSARVGWNHYAFIKDETQGKIQIYFNGELAESDGVVDNTLIGVRRKPFKIGTRTGDPADGGTSRMDDFLVYDRALTGNEILRQYYSGGPVGKVEQAWLPDPVDRAVDVHRDANLGWDPGDSAVEHDVYLGTDFDDVNDATTATASIYKARQDPCEYDPAGNFELNTTYYWRIDEVNDPCVWKGNVWRFTTADFLVIDDFETYNDSDNVIYDTWEDEGWNYTGARLDLGTTPINPVHTLSQSMEYSYDNFTKWDWVSYWSLAELPFGSPQDWTEVEMKTLTLYLYGHPDNDINDTEQLYASLDDDSAGHAEVPYPDMNDLLLEEWTEWNIPISDFNNPDDIDETEVTRLGLIFGSSSNTTIPGGDGLVYFDDIRLYASRCVPSIIKPYADLSNNCIVDWPDVRIMGEHWLRTDANLNPVSDPGPANLVGHWELDGDANDSSGNNYHGTAEGDYDWIDGEIGPGAIDLFGGWVVVEDEGNTPQLRPANQVSVAAWIRLASSQPDTTRLVIKGRDNYESYATEISGDRFGFFIRNVGAQQYTVDSEDSLPLNEWVHIAGTYDNNELTAYMNGQIQGTSTVGAHVLLADANDGLGIGGRYGDMSGRFSGGFDDVRVYDRALTAVEVGYLATDGSGYVPLNSVANLYDVEPAEEKAVNLKDIAVLLGAWLDKTYWP